MKKIMSALLLAAVFVLTGCSAISAGTVTEKKYTPSWVQTSYDQQCISRKADGSCTGYTTVPRYTYWPERHTLSLKDDEDRTGWVTVSAGEYDSYEVGDYYPRSK